MANEIEVAHTNGKYLVIVAVIALAPPLIQYIPPLFKTDTKPDIEGAEIAPQQTPTPTEAVSGFGVRETRSEGLFYRAESDGFVVIYSGGNNPSKAADILSGVTTDKNDQNTRARLAGAYSSAMTPIAKDEYWIAKNRSSGTLHVFWLPVN